MPIDRVKALVKILDQSGLQSIEVEWEGFSFKGKKAQAKTEVLSQGASAPTQTAPAETVSLPIAKEPEGLVSSPLVGTLYLAPSPDADPYVQVGDYVEKGQTLCIIEAMKIMNEVAAPHSGRLTQILGENGAVVGYGDGLFVVEEAHV